MKESCRKRTRHTTMSISRSVSVTAMTSNVEEHRQVQVSFFVHCHEKNSLHQDIYLQCRQSRNFSAATEKRGKGLSETWSENARKESWKLLFVWAKGSGATESYYRQKKHDMTALQLVLSDSCPPSDNDVYAEPSPSSTVGVPTAMAHRERPKNLKIIGRWESRACTCWGSTHT